MQPIDHASTVTPDAPPAGARPNDLRGLFHATNALWGVLAYHFIVPRWLAAGAIGTLAVAWTVVELLRVRSPRVNAQVLAHPFFSRVIRGHERERISGAAFFLWGVFLTLALFPRPAAELGCLVMGFGDPAAVLVGTRHGRIRLTRRRSLEGTLAFFLAAFAATFAFRALLYPAAPFEWTLGVAAIVAAVGAAAEVLSGRLDDNLTVPVVSAAAAFALLTLFPPGV